MDKIQLYKEIISHFPDLEVKGATMPYTSVNGNMFSFFSKDGQFSLRLPAPARDKFIQDLKTQLSVQHGVVIKEYVVVPDKVFEDLALLEEYFRVSYAYAMTLKAKATARKKSS